MVTPPRYLQDSSWRKKDIANDSLPGTLYQPSYSPWSTTDLSNPKLKSNASRRTAEASNSPQVLSSPRNRVGSSSTTHIRNSSWRKTEMSTQPESSEDRVRPRLQLQIPGHSAGGENQSTSQLRNDSPQNDLALLNAAADIFIPQQALNAANIFSSNTGTQEPSAARSAAAMRLPVIASLADGLLRHLSYQIDEGAPMDTLPPAQPLSQNTVGDRASDLRETASPTLGNSSPRLGPPISTSIASPTSEALLPGNIMGGDRPGTAAQVSHSHHPSLASSPTQAEDLRQANRAWPSKGPMHLARRQAYGNGSVRAGERRGCPNQPREASHSNSRTWVHPRTRLQAKWAEVYKHLKGMSLIKEGQQSPTGPPVVVIVGGSFCVPKSLNEWIEHRTEFANDRAKEARQRLCALQEHKLLPRHPDLPPAGEIAPITVPPFGGKKFRDGRSAVLAANTIWSPWKPDRSELEIPREERPHALWPCPEEMKEEGNERNTSQYRRFLALPRVPGNPTVNWKQKKVLPMLSFDEVWKLPSRETYYDQRTVTSPEDMEKMESMIGEDLLAAIDCDLDDE